MVSVWFDLCQKWDSRMVWLAGGKFHRSCCQDHKVRSSWWCLLGENWQSFSSGIHSSLSFTLSRNARPASIEDRNGLISTISFQCVLIKLRYIIKTLDAPSRELTKFCDYLERLHKNWGRIKPTNNYRDISLIHQRNCPRSQCGKFCKEYGRDVAKREQPNCKKIGTFF